jgi:hypothetical protein
MSEASESLETEMDMTPITDIAPSPATSHMIINNDDEEYKRDEAERQALTPTPSEPSSPTTPDDTHSVHSYNPFQVVVPGGEHTRKISTNSWEGNATAANGTHQEPNWEMITIGKLAEPGDRFSGAQVRVVTEEEPSPIDNRVPAPQVWHPLRMNSLVEKKGRSKSRPDLKSTMTSQPLPGTVEVQIARSMSVTKGARARPVLRTSPRGVEKGKGENLIKRKPLTPRVVEPQVGADDSMRGHKPMKSVSASIVDVA